MVVHWTPMDVFNGYIQKIYSSYKIKTTELLFSRTVQRVQTLGTPFRFFGFSKSQCLKTRAKVAKRQLLLSVFKCGLFKM